ncbi:MAG: glycyl radical protein [Chitinispirillaceae bacterium]|nr:glycyl radical protein [Chitinispirillaceae bacterium]
MITERIKKLRAQSVETPPSISMERAVLLTEFYRSSEAANVSEPVKRALAFQYLMERKTVYIGDGELVVGERGPAPRAVPTYPEITIHSLKDLDLLNSRTKTPYTVSKEVRDRYEKEIIPYWLGKSMRERIFSLVSSEWKTAYGAGIFTEFMEQRAPGHTVLDGKIYKKGFIDFIGEIDATMRSIDWVNDPDAFDRNEELKAMKIAARALIRFAERHAESADALAAKEGDPVRKKELERIAQNCRRVPAHPPRDVWEAVQYYWFVHLGVVTEFNTWDSFNPGRLDQHLLPFYQSDLAGGSFTKERIIEILQALWIKFNNQPAPPKMGVTAEESGTYTDFALINFGGVKPDGSDAVNELSYILLDIVEEMRLLQPSSMVQVSKKNPDAFIQRALKIIKTGFGQPSVFNTDAIIQEMLRMGKSLEDAREGGASGCVETGAFGKEAYILTGYFNLPKVLEITLNNGVDMRTGAKVGLETGDPSSFTTFGEVMAAYEKQVDYFLTIKIKGSNLIERLYARFMPAPFLSVLVNDCIARGKDYHDGGARYNTSYIQGVGMGTITDSLSSLRQHCFENRRISLAVLRDVLRDDFNGQEELRQIFINKTPKWGNDDDFADDHARAVFEIYYHAVNGKPNTRGGSYRVLLLPTTAHVYFGKVTCATPDGRKAFEAVSEGISPVQGADRHGPTAVIKSAAKLDHLRTGGTLLNQKFTPQFFKDDSALNKLTHLIRTYFSLDGHHVQFNVVGAQTLIAAQKEPQKYRDLIVRVAGYSDYFVDLSIELQNEIIKRTEQTDV